MNRLLTSLFCRVALPLLLPLALLLAQHSVWAHNFAHDSATMAAHGQTPDHAPHACCLPYQTAGDAACGAPSLVAGATGSITPDCAAAPGRPAETLLPYSSRAPPSTS